MSLPQCFLGDSELTGSCTVQELSRAAMLRQQAGGGASVRSTAAAPADTGSAGLRRSSRVRTEVSMPEYEGGAEWTEEGELYSSFSCPP